MMEHHFAHGAKTIICGRMSAEFVDKVQRESERTKGHYYPTINGLKVKFFSKKLKLFFKSKTCVCCGLRGSFYQL